jgi:hypothetical protein
MNLVIPFFFYKSFVSRFPHYSPRSPLTLTLSRGGERELFRGFPDEF